MAIGFRDTPGRVEPAALLEMADNLRRFADESEARMRAEGPITPAWAKWLAEQRAGADATEIEARRLLGKPS